MGIRLVEAIQLTNLLTEIISHRTNVSPPIKVCSLGYPDFLFTPQALSNNCTIPDMKPKLASLNTCSYKGDLTNADTVQYVDPKSFFKLFNAKLDVIDVQKHRGDELIIDLNYSNSTLALAGQYDLVIDNGTLEHCFNIGEALINTASLIKSNCAYVFHINPLLMINHGFYNICPTLLFDFYSQNHFRIHSIYATGVKSQKSVKINATQRYSLIKEFSNEEIIMNFIACSPIEKLNQKNYRFSIQYKQNTRKY